MPTYEYECEACGHEFEELQSMSDRPIRKCPKCKKLRVRRLISGGAGVIFKGSGFYETDYKRKRAGPDSAGKAKDAGDGDSSASSPKKDGGEKTPAAGTDSGAAKGKADGKTDGKGGKQSRGKD